MPDYHYSKEIQYRVGNGVAKYLSKREYDELIGIVGAGNVVPVHVADEVAARERRNDATRTLASKVGRGEQGVVASFLASVEGDTFDDVLDAALLAKENGSSLAHEVSVRPKTAIERILLEGEVTGARDSLRRNISRAVEDGSIMDLLQGLD